MQECSLLLLPVPAEDVSGEPGGLGGVVSTISSSRSPLQPPDADDGEPFTTYFDSKIPIPEDETVSGKTLLEKPASDTHLSHSHGHQFPFQPALGAGNGGWERGRGSPVLWGVWGVC